MGIVDAGIDDCHDYIAATGGNAPRVRCPDVRPGCPPGLAGIPEPPELSEPGVIRLALNGVEEVRLGVLHFRVGLVKIDCFVDTHALPEFQVMQAQGGKFLQLFCTMLFVELLLVLLRRALPELHQDFVILLFCFCGILGREVASMRYIQISLMGKDGMSVVAWHAFFDKSSMNIGYTQNDHQ